MTDTIIPRWLYENDLPDEELQRVYVREAKKKVEQIADQLREVNAERAELCRAFDRAVAFLDQAEAALARYRRRRRG